MSKEKLSKVLAEMELNLHYINILQELAMDGAADGHKISDYAGLLSILIKNLKANSAKIDALLYEKI